MLAHREQKDRPVLNAVGLHRGNLPRQPLLCLRPRERSANKPGHLGISPQTHRQIDVRVGPEAKYESLAPEETGRRLWSGAAGRLLREAHKSTRSERWLRRRG